MAQGPLLETDLDTSVRRGLVEVLSNAEEQLRKSEALNGQAKNRYQMLQVKLMGQFGPARPAGDELESARLSSSNRTQYSEHEDGSSNHRCLEHIHLPSKTDVAAVVGSKSFSFCQSCVRGGELACVGIAFEFCRLGITDSSTFDTWVFEPEFFRLAMSEGINNYVASGLNREFEGYVEPAAFFSRLEGTEILTRSGLRSQSQRELILSTTKAQALVTFHTLHSAVQEKHARLACLVTTRKTTAALVFLETAGVVWCDSHQRGVDGAPCPSEEGGGAFVARFDNLQPFSDFMGSFLSDNFQVDLAILPFRDSWSREDFVFDFGPVDNSFPGSKNGPAPAAGRV